MCWTLRGNYEHWTRSSIHNRKIKYYIKQRFPNFFLFIKILIPLAKLSLYSILLELSSLVQRSQFNEWSDESQESGSHNITNCVQPGPLWGQQIIFSQYFPVIRIILVFLQMAVEFRAFYF